MVRLKCLCLHGFGENKEIYNPFLEEMSKLMPTKSIDLIGHGDYLEREYKIDEVMEYLSGQILELASEVILVGTSFGGILSYIMSSQNQTKYKEARDRIKGVIINDVPCCVPRSSFTNIAVNLFALADKHYGNLNELDEDYTKNGFKLDRMPIENQNWQHFLEHSLRGGKVKYDIKFIETILSENRGMTTVAPEIAFNKMPDGTEALDLRHYYYAIQKPILLFIGERSTFFPPHVYDFMLTHANTEKHIIPDGGHFLDLSRPEIMNHIGSWLQEVSCDEVMMKQEEDTASLTCDA